MEDAYLKSRMDDLDHVIGRIHAFLQKRQPDSEGLAGEILVCENVAPSELAQLQAQGVVRHRHQRRQHPVAQRDPGAQPPPCRWWSASPTRCRRSTTATC